MCWIWAIYTCSNRVFNAPDSLPTRLRIDEAFGATHPEDFCEEEQQYVLTFPGLAFYFPSEAKVCVMQMTFSNYFKIPVLLLLILHILLSRCILYFWWFCNSIFFSLVWVQWTAALGDICADLQWEATRERSCSILASLPWPSTPRHAYGDTGQRHHQRCQAHNAVRHGRSVQFSFLYFLWKITLNMTVAVFIFLLQIGMSIFCLYISQL